MEMSECIYLLEVQNKTGQGMIIEIWQSNI